MKHVLKLSIPLFVAFLISSRSFAAINFVLLPDKPSGHQQTGATNPSPFAGMTLREFLALTPGKYKELTGKRMTLTQKLSLKLAQFRVKKMVKKNQPADLLLIAGDIDSNNFDIPGFILGIVLGPIGILIAYLIEGRNSSMFRWALIGSIIWLGIFLLVVLVL